MAALYRKLPVSILVLTFAVCYFSSNLTVINARTVLQPAISSLLNDNISRGTWNATVENKYIAKLNSSHKYKQKTNSLQEAIERSQNIVLSLKDEFGAPGIVIGVSVNGKNVWSEGFGVSDVQNRVPCTPNTVLRIASISKSVTMIVVAKLWEDGRLDLDVPVQKYVPDFPTKFVDGQPVNISCRHLVSHLSGIRHYSRKSENDSQADEFLLNKRFKTVEDSLKLFENDELFFKPGEDYLYTTNGFTLLSAVVENIIGEPFEDIMTKTFRELGMMDTYLDLNENMISNRASYYVVPDKSDNRIQNAPYVDNSYKWAGGGYLSTVGDLLKFGNIMLYSYQHSNESKGLSGYLKQKTVKAMWTPTPQSNKALKELGYEGYGMGWVICNNKQVFGGGPLQRFCAAHSGGAVGATSFLYILPPYKETHVAPSGVTVAIITNIEGVDFIKTAKQIALLFEKANQH